MNPANDRVYDSGGVQKIHQAIVQYAVQQKNDPNCEWMKNFMGRFFFFETGRLNRIARSSPSGAKFADLIIFQKQTAQEDEFGAHI